MIVLLPIRSFWKIIELHRQLLSGVVNLPSAAASRRAHGQQSEINNGIREMSRCIQRTASEEKKCERSRRREMKTEAERNGGDQRHVEFTITLLGCAVIKAGSPQRGRRLQACPVRSLAPLISSVSPTERQHQNLQEGLFFIAAPPPPAPAAPKNLQSKRRLS